MGTEGQQLRTDLHVGTVWALPDWTAAPNAEGRAWYEAVAAAGYGGVQGGDPALCREVGLVPTTFGTVREPGALADLAALWCDLGFAAATLHVGTGLESEAEAATLVEEVLAVEAAVGLPLYVETHRATLTQDLWRTVQLCERWPELRFNGDFSHWYTGLEMPYGDFDAKVAFCGPVFDRVRFLHGRIGDSGCVQIDVLAGGEAVEVAVGHFRALWTEAMRGFRRTAGPGAVLPFVPELLPPSIGYARTVPGPDGDPAETSDRWLQAARLCEIARGCWEDSAGS